MTEEPRNRGESPEDGLEGLVLEGKSAYRTVEEMTLGILRAGILRGVLKPGERLSQDRLAEVLEVSRMPIRAALRQLEGEGLVVFQPHKGAIVRVLSADELAELYDLRVLIECYAIAKVAENITDFDLDELELLASAMAAEGETEEWIDLREQFYRGLYAIAGRPRTLELIMRLRREVGRYWLRRRIDAPNGGHLELLRILRGRDSSEAQAWLRQHLQHVSEELQSLEGTRNQA